ncbi:MAG: NAD-dependent epimerase/dehydratase family protein [Cypionkella sp.]
MRESVLLTGASGVVGTLLRPYLLKRFGTLRLTDRVAPASMDAGETFLLADLTDPQAALAATKGVDAIIHLAGLPGEGTWDQVIQASMMTTVNMLEAARQVGAGRFVFASSNHAIGYHPRSRKLTGDERVLPDSRYGVAKAFGEACLALYADKYGMKCMSIRIGTVIDRPRSLRELSTFHHPEDLAQLISIGIEHAEVRNEIVWGQSDNLRSWWDNSRAAALGYRPVHRAEDHVTFATEGEARQQPDPLASVLQGGGMASRDFTGDMSVWGVE